MPQRRIFPVFGNGNDEYKSSLRYKKYFVILTKADEHGFRILLDLYIGGFLKDGSFL